MKEQLKLIFREFKSTKEERVIHKEYRKNVKKLKKLVISDKGKTEDNSFQHDITIVAIMKNEGEYLKEWIEYHKLVGADFFVLYDHESTDNTYELLEPYIKDGLVDYNRVETPGSKLHHPQKEMYTDAVVRYREKTRWMAFIDVDEFIVPENEMTIIEELNNIIEKIGKANLGGVGISWINYGSSNFEKKPQGLVIENFVWRSKDEYEGNRLVKSIVNPRRVISGEIHQPIYYNSFKGYNECGQEIDETNQITNSHKYIRINHYASKSKEEARKRMLRKFGGANLARNSHDINDIKDDIMLRYVEKLKEQKI